MYLKHSGDEQTKKKKYNTMYVRQSYCHIAFYKWMYFTIENLQLIFFPIFGSLCDKRTAVSVGYILPQMKG